MNPNKKYPEVISEEWTQRWSDYHWGKVDIIWCFIFVILVFSMIYWSYIVYLTR